MEFLHEINNIVFLAYGALMAWFYQGIRSSKSKISSNEVRPKISIIVSLRNESQNVGELLKGLLEIDYPKDNLEIILVNDNSTDDTFERLKAFESDQVRVLQNKGEGKKQAIETGVSQANGEWVATTDADCEVPTTWIESLVNRLRSGSKMVLGPVFIKDTSSFLGQIQTIEFLGLQGSTCGSAGIGKPISANAANMLFKKDVFKELNPYQNNYHLNTGDDQFLLMAITEKYPKSVTYSLDNGSVIFTHPVRTWDKYISQRIRWVSKGAAYSQSFPKWVGLLVVAISGLVIVNLISGLIIGNMRLAFYPVLAKMMIDLFVIFPMKRFSGVKVNPIYYPLSTLIYSFVVIFTVVAGLFKK